MSHAGLGKHAATHWTTEEWHDFVDGAKESVDLYVAVTEALGADVKPEPKPKPKPKPKK